MTTDTGQRQSLTPSRPRRRMRRYLLILGPGVIAASAGNDAGGIVTYASAGAQFGFRTLFLLVLITVALVIVQEMAARLGAITGQGLVSLIREEFSLRVAAFAVVCLVVANVGLVVSEFAGVAAAMEIFGVSRYISVPVASVVIWASVIYGSYRYAERIFLALSLIFFAYPVAAILAHPNWHLVLSNTFLPHFPASRAFLLLAVALVGTTITPYMQLYQAAAVADRGIGPDEYKMERIDAIGGAIFSDIIAMAIIVATGAAIGGSGPLDSAKQAARALRPVAGAAAEKLFGIGLLGASALAAAVVPLSTAYALAEAIGAERSVSRKFSEARLFLGLFSGQVAIGAFLALKPGNLFNLLLATQVLNGLITPIILAFILILANRRSLLGKAANGPVFRRVAFACICAVGALSIVVLAQTVLGGFGFP
ncbi:MAG: Nramp family divalent metal transporter [Actinomycetota bacterium]